MTIPFGGIHLDPVEIGINGNAILGIKESGKSYLGTEIAELFFDNGIPFVAFDPIGLWHNMRYPGRGKGYPVVVAGGFHGDIPLTPANAPSIVEAAMKEGVSLVLDLFHPELSKADWRAIVRDCAFLLLHRNAQYGLRHVFIEEAAEFVPQQPRDTQVYDAVERVIRMGGNSRLGCTLISPRSQEVNKAVLELCENLFLFRQRGKNALENIKKWLDVAGAEAKEVMRTLPTMPRGECWAWLGGSDTPAHVKVPTKRSFHPDRRATQGDVEAPRGKAVNVSKFVAALEATLPQLEEAAKASDPKVLRGRIAELERNLAAAVKGHVPTWPDQREEVRRLKLELADALAMAERRAGMIDNARAALQLTEIPAVQGGRDPAQPTRRAERRKPDLQRAAPSPPSHAGEGLTVGETTPLTGPQRHLLQALAWWKEMGHDEPSRVQVAAKAEWKPKGSNLRDRLSELHRRGLVTYPRTGHVELTPAGVAAAPTPDTSATLVDSVRRILTKPQSGLFEALLARRATVSRAELAAEVGWEPSGSNLRDRLSELKQLELVEYPARGDVRLQAWVRGDG